MPTIRRTDVTLFTSAASVGAAVSACAAHDQRVVALGIDERMVERMVQRMDSLNQELLTVCCNVARVSQCRGFMFKTISLSAFATALSLFATTGASGCDKADEAFDCNQICNRYSDCFDEGYDVGACVDACEDNAANSDNFSNHADDCENCLDDRSCTGSFSCADECSGIVP